MQNSKLKPKGPFFRSYFTSTSSAIIRCWAFLPENCTADTWWLYFASCSYNLTRRIRCIFINIILWINVINERNRKMMAIFVHVNIHNKIIHYSFAVIKSSELLTTCCYGNGEFINVTSRILTILKRKNLINFSSNFN